jgi:hypothetical protein
LLKRLVRREGKTQMKNDSRNGRINEGRKKRKDEKEDMKIRKNMAMCCEAKHVINGII